MEMYGIVVISVITRQRRRQISKDEVRYSCDQCYKATQKGTLDRHIDSVHGDVCHWYICDQFI